MKIVKTSPTPQFKPISISIIIETEEELEALQKMTRFNVSIPELVSDRKHQRIVHEFLGAIQDLIVE